MASGCSSLHAVSGVWKERGSLGARSAVDLCAVLCIFLCFSHLQAVDFLMIWLCAYLNVSGAGRESKTEKITFLTHLSYF